MKALGLGFTLLVSTPVALVILVSSPVGVPIATVLLDVYLIGLLFAYFAAALAIGRGVARLFRTSGVSGPGRRITLMVVGVVVLGVITFVPAFGALVLLVTPSLSLGALTLEL